MPYSPHMGFNCPQDDSVSVWRYVDLARFLDLVMHGHLAFARADLMQDKHEGAYHEGELSRLVSAFRSLSFGSATWQAKIDTLEREGQARYAAMARSGTYLSCWHMNRGESGAMWAIYASQGIAIESTVGRLRESFNDGKGHPIHLGVVQYGYISDPRTFDGPAQNSILYKRDLYEYERELRAVILPDPQAISVNPSRVIKVKIDLRTLIKRVWLGPKQSGWFEEMINDLLLDYELPNIPVVRSTMDDDPLVLGSSA